MEVQMKSSVIKDVLERYGSIEKILNAAKQERWPYPKTFGLLETVGVKSYIVKFIDEYDANYYGEGHNLLYKEKPPEGYRPLQVSEEFFPKGVENAIIKHMRDKTPFTNFLEDIANAGVSHFIVNMDARMVSYNDSEDQFYAENVPNWNWDLE